MTDINATQTQQPVKEVPEWTHVLSMFDSMFSAALRYTEPQIKRMVDDATAPLLARIAALEARLEDITTASDERIKEIAEEVADRRISEHADEYDHDEYDRMDDKLDEKVTEAIEDFDFEDKVRDIMRNASINIDI